MSPAPAARLAALRRAIDVVDAGLLVLLAARGRLARQAGALKRGIGAGARDPAREREVHARARRLASALGVSSRSAQALLAVAIDDACRLQGLAPDVDQGGAWPVARMIAPAMTVSASSRPETSRWLRLLPPPARLAPLLRALPPTVRRRVLERGMARVLAAPLRADALDFLRDRRLGIEVTDLGLRWVVTLDGEGLRAIDADAEASVRGSATDLLLLAGRLEDADTLFFQRRLVLTGDTELGLTARNLLDRLPWEEVPLALRIALNRGARLARAARDAYHAA